MPDGSGQSPVPVATIDRYHQSLALPQTVDGQHDGTVVCAGSRDRGWNVREKTPRLAAPAGLMRLQFQRESFIAWVDPTPDWHTSQGLGRPSCSVQLRCSGLRATPH